jgi:hypothetical protein
MWFNKTQIKNGTYLRTTHTQAEEHQLAIRSMVREVLDGYTRNPGQSQGILK